MVGIVVGITEHSEIGEGEFQERTRGERAETCFRIEEKNPWFGVPVGFSDLEEIGRSAPGNGSVKVSESVRGIEGVSRLDHHPDSERLPSSDRRDDATPALDRIGETGPRRFLACPREAARSQAIAKVVDGSRSTHPSSVSIATLSGLVRLTHPIGEKAPRRGRSARGQSVRLVGGSARQLLFKVATTENQFDINVDKMPLKHGALSSQRRRAGVRRGGQVAFRHHAQTIHSLSIFTFQIIGRRAQASADPTRTLMEPLVMAADCFPFVSTPSLIPCGERLGSSAYRRSSSASAGVWRDGKHES
jgi:hypothetical protein